MFLTFAAIAVGLFVAYYCIGPILVYRQNRMPAFPSFFPLTDAEFDQQVSDDLARRSEALRMLGFEPVANLQSINPATHTYTRIFHNHITSERANITEIRAYREGTTTPTVSSGYIEFTTTYFDAPEVNTNNVKLPGVFKRLPDKQIFSVPTVEEPADLYKVHQTLTRRTPGTIKPPPAASQIADEIQREFYIAYEKQAEAGYIWLDAAESVYRPTAKGAVLMTWRILWPTGSLRAWQMRKAGERMLSEARSH